MTLTIKNATEISEQVVQFAKKIHDAMSDWDEYSFSFCGGYYFEKMSKGENLDKIIAFTDGCTVIDTASFGTFMGVPVVFPDFQSEFHADVLNAIRKKYGENVIVRGRYDILKSNGLLPCSFKSQYAEDAEYHVGGYDLPYFVFSADKVNIARDAIEKKYMQAELGNIEYRLMSPRELFEYIFNKDMANAPYWCVDNGFSHVVGFNYLEFQYNNPTDNFLVAISNGIVVGCIKYGVFNDNQYGLCYIDVSVPYRCKGIATGLIRELSHIIDDKYPLVLSRESEMGAMCHMHDHFKAFKWNTKVYVENRETYKYEQIA